MTRVVSFADSFSSASAPTLSGNSDNFTINNNVSSATNITGLVFSSSSYTSVLVDFELERKTDSATHRQKGSFALVYDGTTWSINIGASAGSDIIADTLSSTEKITLTVTSAGQVQYTSGNLAGTNYEGTLKCNISRFSA